MPPPSEQDSKIAMLQMLAPNAMKAYKRKKLSLFPSAANNSAVRKVAEIDLDSGDDIAEIPFVPPLPDYAPPAPPPPPAGPPPSPEEKVASADITTEDIEVVKGIRVWDIPIPEVLPITIDDEDVDEGHLYGMPPPSEQDSKIAMLQMLAPNAMKAYKRKKLSLFPSAANNSAVQEVVAEMDLDSRDEIAEFPSVPPLPDYAPPALPPHPAGPPPAPEEKVASADIPTDDIEVVEGIRVWDIPIPEVLPITIDDEDVDEKAAQEPIGLDSPSLDNLEEKKRQLLNAVDGDEVAYTISTEPDLKNDDTISLGEIEAQLDEALKTDHAKKANLSNASDSNDEDLKEITKKYKNINKETLSEDMKENNTDAKVIYLSLNKEKILLSDTDLDKEKPPDKDKSSPKQVATTNAIVASTLTPKLKVGHVKSTLYGTPVMNIASPYDKLPSDHNFAKDICDVIHFENLPNSIGKYKKISNILKRVKNEVDRIQES